MPPYAGPTTPNRGGDVAGTLRLLAYLALGLVLLVLDHRGGWLNRARQQASLLVQPLWMVAGLPGRVAQTLYDDAGTLAQLTEDNERLRNELLLNSARITRLQTLATDNARLRGLLGAAERGNPVSSCRCWRPISSTSISIRPGNGSCSTPAATTACGSARA